MQLHDDTDEATTNDNNNNKRYERIQIQFADASNASGDDPPRGAPRQTIRRGTLQREHPPFKGVPARVLCAVRTAAGLPSPRRVTHGSSAWAARGRRWRRRGRDVGSTTCVFCLFVCVLLPCRFGRGGDACVLRGLAGCCLPHVFLRGGVRGGRVGKGEAAPNRAPLSAQGAWA